MARVPNRPKRPLNHSRYAPLEFHNNSDDYAPDALIGAPGWPKLFPRAATERWRRQMGRFTNQPRGALVYPSHNGHFDPLSIAAVVDCILRLEIGPYINAGNLAYELTRHYDQIVWDPVTVGRILSDLVSFAHELKMPSEQHEYPVYLRKHGGIRNYIIHNDPNGWQWLGLVRDYMGNKATEFVRENNRERSVDLWNPVFDFKYGQRVEG